MSSSSVASSSSTITSRSGKSKETQYIEHALALAKKEVEITDIEAATVLAVWNEVEVKLILY
jgi:BRCT domain type II-containing protein